MSRSEETARADSVSAASRLMGARSIATVNAGRLAGHVAAGRAGQRRRLLIYPSSGHRSPDSVEDLVAGHGHSIRQLHQVVEFSPCDRFHDCRVCEVVGVRLGDDRLELGGYLGELGIIEADVQGEPGGPIGEVGGERGGRLLDLTGYPLCCHNAPEHRRQVTPGAIVPSPQEGRPPGPSGLGRERLVHPPGEDRREFAIKQGLVGAGFAQKRGQLADQGPQPRARVNPDRWEVPLSADGGPDSRDRRVGEPSKFLRRQCTSNGICDRYRGQPGGHERVPLQLGVEILALEPPRVLEQRRQEIGRDEAIDVGSLELFGEELGTVERRVDRLEGEGCGQQQGEDEAREHGGGPADPDPHVAPGRARGAARAGGNVGATVHRRDPSAAQSES